MAFLLSQGGLNYGNFVVLYFADKPHNGCRQWLVYTVTNEHLRICVARSFNLGL